MPSRDARRKSGSVMRPFYKAVWSGWDGVGTAAVTLVGPIAYFTRVG
jgi:hypothetical protein